MKKWFSNLFGAPDADENLVEELNAILLRSREPDPEFHAFLEAMVQLETFRRVSASKPFAERAQLRHRLDAGLTAFLAAACSNLKAVLKTKGEALQVCYSWLDLCSLIIAYMLAYAHTNSLLCTQHLNLFEMVIFTHSLPSAQVTNTIMSRLMPPSIFGPRLFALLRYVIRNERKARMILNSGVPMLLVRILQKLTRKEQIERSMHLAVFVLAGFFRNTHSPP